MIDIKIPKKSVSRMAFIVVLMMCLLAEPPRGPSISGSGSPSVSAEVQASPPADRKKKSSRSFRVMSQDAIPLDVELLLDSEGVPEAYHCPVRTPVCDDGLCRLLIVDIYWDLLGNYSRFEVPASLSLTKWDHQKFTPEDYCRLDKILRDKYSLLGTMSDVNALLDPSEKKISETVDAVSGATLKTLENAVVPGAGYSSYVLWHIVNGKIPARIRETKEAIRSPELIRKFLLSDNDKYHYEALEFLVSQEDDRFLP